MPPIRACWGTVWRADPFWSVINQQKELQWLTGHVMEGCETCDSNLKVIQPSLHNTVLDRIRSIADAVSCHTPATQTSRPSEFLIRECFLEREKEAWTFNSRLFWLNYSTLSSEHEWSSPPLLPGKKKKRERTCFLIWNTRSSPYKNNRISAVLTGSLYILRQKIYALTAVPSVKWESSDSASARKHMPSILESLAESQINGEKDKTRESVNVVNGMETVRGEKGSQNRFISSHPLKLTWAMAVRPPCP